MQNFYIKVRASVPVPREKEYTISGSHFGTACQRAIKKFRHDLGQKRIDELTIYAKRLGNSTLGTCQADKTETEEKVNKGGKQTEISDFCQTVKCKGSIKSKDYNIGLDFLN